MPQLQLGDEEYRIVGDGGEEGETVLYGETATLDAGDVHLTAIVDFEEGAGEDDPVVGLLPGGAKMIETLTGEVVECEEVETEFVYPTEAEAAVGGGIPIESDDSEDDDEDEFDDDLDGEESEDDDDDLDDDSDDSEDGEEDTVDEELEAYARH